MYVTDVTLSVTLEVNDMYRCTSWTCSNIETSEEVKVCPKCHIRLKEASIPDDIHRICELAKNFFNADKYSERDKKDAISKIDSISETVNNLFFKDDSNRYNKHAKTFYYTYGLVDTYIHARKTNNNIMREHEICNGEIISGSIKMAQTRVSKLVMKENEEIAKRFASEQPQWTSIYDIEELSRSGMSRIFKRDVNDTGKVAYIHLSWETEKQQT